MVASIGYDDEADYDDDGDASTSCRSYGVVVVMHASRVLMNTLLPSISGCGGTGRAAVCQA